MALTEKQKYDLNHMNVASQNIELGNVVDGLNGMANQSASAVIITGGSIVAQYASFGDSEHRTIFEEDGTMVASGSATVWDDIFFPLVTAKQGQTDKPAFSLTEIAYLFPENDTSASMLMVAQFPHSRKLNSNISPHVHWKQTQSGSVVFKMAYKWFPIGGSVPNTWETHTMATSVIPYTSGSVHQLNSGGYISGSMIDENGEDGVSSIMLIKLYREDSTYDGNAVTYQFDIHYEKDTLGSHELYTK